MSSSAATSRGRRRLRHATDITELFAPQRTPTSELPDPGALIFALTRGTFEVLAGTRDVEQLARWLAETPYRRLVSRSHLSRRARHAQRQPARRPAFAIRAIRQDSPADGVVEAAVVVAMPDRTRAVALRLEGIDGRWRATDLRVL